MLSPGRQASDPACSLNNSLPLPSRAVQQMSESGAPALSARATDGDSEEALFLLHATTPEPRRRSSHTPSTGCRDGACPLSLPNSCHRSVAPERLSLVYGSNPFSENAMRHTTMLPPQPQGVHGGDHYTEATATFTDPAKLVTREDAKGGVGSTPACAGVVPQRLSTGALRYTSTPLTTVTEQRGGGGNESEETCRSGGDAGIGGVGWHPHYPHDKTECMLLLSSPCAEDPSAPRHITTAGRGCVPPVPFEASNTGRRAADASNSVDTCAEEEVLFTRPTFSPPYHRTGCPSAADNLSVAAVNQRSALLDVDVGFTALSSSSASVPMTLSLSRQWAGVTRLPYSNEETMGTQDGHDEQTQERRMPHRRHSQDSQRNEDSSSSSSSSSLLSPLAELEQAPRKSYARADYVRLDDNGNGNGNGNGFVARGRDHSPSTAASATEAEEEEGVRGKRATLLPSFSHDPVSGDGDSGDDGARLCVLHELESFGTAVPCVGACSSADTAGRSRPTTAAAHHITALDQGEPLAGGLDVVNPAVLSRLSDASLHSSSQPIVPLPPCCWPPNRGERLDSSTASRPRDWDESSDRSQQHHVVCYGTGPTLLSHVSLYEETTTQGSLTNGEAPNMVVVVPPGVNPAAYQQQHHGVAAVSATDLADQLTRLTLQSGSPTQKRLAFDDAVDDVGVHGSGGRRAREEEGCNEGGGPQRSGRSDFRRGRGGDGEGGPRGRNPQPFTPPPPHSAFFTSEGVPPEPTPSPRVWRQRPYDQCPQSSYCGSGRRPEARQAPASAVAARRAAMNTRSTGLQLLQSRKRCLEEVSAMDGQVECLPLPLLERPARELAAEEGRTLRPFADRYGDGDGSGGGGGGGDGDGCSTSASTSIDMDYLTSIKRCRREYQHHKHKLQTQNQHQHQSPPPPLPLPPPAEGFAAVVLQELPANAFLSFQSLGQQSPLPHDVTTAMKTSRHHRSKSAGAAPASVTH